MPPVTEWVLHLGCMEGGWYGYRRMFLTVHITKRHFGGSLWEVKLKFGQKIDLHFIFSKKYANAWNFKQLSFFRFLREKLGENPWHKQLSAYHHTPAKAIPISSAVMTGIGQSINTRRLSFILTTWLWLWIRPQRICLHEYDQTIRFVRE